MPKKYDDGLNYKQRYYKRHKTEIQKKQIRSTVFKYFNNLDSREKVDQAFRSILKEWENNHK